MSNSNSSNNKRKKSRAVYPELREEAIKELNLQSELDKVGGHFELLDPYFIGLIGGYVTKKFNALAEEALVSGVKQVSDIKDYSTHNSSLIVEKFNSNPNYIKEINPTLFN